MTDPIMAAELTRDEGLRLLVYDDATGKALTKGSVCLGHAAIGIGRSLDVRGITAEEALYLLNNDIRAFTLGLQQAYTWFGSLSAVRQRVLINMAFNMGLAGLDKFHDMLGYLATGDYEQAATAMQASTWAKQVGGRAVRLVAMMRDDKA